jgi:hypothetical protein
VTASVLVMINVHACEQVQQLERECTELIRQIDEENIRSAKREIEAEAAAPTVAPPHDGDDDAEPLAAAAPSAEDSKASTGSKQSAKGSAAMSSPSSLPSKKSSLGAKGDYQSAMAAKDLALHRQRIAAQRPVVDSSVPPSYPHLSADLKGAQTAREQVRPFDHDQSQR